MASSDPQVWSTPDFDIEPLSTDDQDWPSHPHSRVSGHCSLEHSSTSPKDWFKWIDLEQFYATFQESLNWLRQSGDIKTAYWLLKHLPDYNDASWAPYMSWKDKNSDEEWPIMLEFYDEVARLSADAIEADLDEETDLGDIYRPQTASDCHEALILCDCIREDSTKCMKEGRLIDFSQPPSPFYYLCSRLAAHQIAPGPRDQVEPRIIDDLKALRTRNMRLEIELDQRDMIIEMLLKDLQSKRKAKPAAAWAFRDLRAALRVTDDKVEESGDAQDREEDVEKQDVTQGLAKVMDVPSMATDRIADLLAQQEHS